MSRVEEAYEAIRAHHHEHPYTADPGAVYLDHGHLSLLLAALEHLTEDMARAAQRNTGADDDRELATLAEQTGVSLRDVHGECVEIRLRLACEALADARRHVDEAHNHAGHLIFGQPAA